MSIEEMISEIVRLARVKDHRLGRSMTDGRLLSRQAAEKVLDNLRNCQDRTGTVMNASAGESAARAGSEVTVVMKFEDIPAGFYATKSLTGNNDLDFWKVTRQAGSTFTRAKRVIGGGDEKSPRLIEIPVPQQVRALLAILREGIEESGDLYADNQFRCRDCGLTLTDEVSRAARRGPVCRTKDKGNG